MKRAALLKKLKKRIRRLGNRIALAENYLALASQKPPVQACVKDKAAEKVEHLIALATDPAAGGGESRTAAFLAAQSIRKNNLRVCAGAK